KIRLLQFVKGPVHPAAAPVKVAARLGAQDEIVGAGDELADFLRVGRRQPTLVERAFGLLVIAAGVTDFIPAPFLQQRAGPLREVAAPVMLRVPGAAMDLDLFGWWKTADEFADVNWRKPQGAGAVAVEQRPVKISPEPAFHRCTAE